MIFTHAQSPRHNMETLYSMSYNLIINTQCARYLTFPSCLFLTADLFLTLVWIPSSMPNAFDIVFAPHLTFCLPFSLHFNLTFWICLLCVCLWPVTVTLTYHYVYHDIHSYLSLHVTHYLSIWTAAYLTDELITRFIIQNTNTWHTESKNRENLRHGRYYFRQRSEEARW